MGKSLLMKTDTSTALNFMIYIQNIFLNQTRNEDELRYPYLSKKVDFNEDFELKYKELWNEVIKRIADDDYNDVRIFYEEKDLFYQHLFKNNSDSMNDFSAVHKSFNVWWNSLVGGFSVERSIDEIGQKLYVDLAKSLTQGELEPHKVLHISLIYDECLVANAEVSSYFAVLSIKDLFIKYKELVPKLRRCIY